MSRSLLQSEIQEVWKPMGMDSILTSGYPFDNFDALAPTDRHGLIKSGGELNPDWVMEAYAKGIFPWYETPPIKWYSPPRRLVLFPGDFKVSRSFGKFLRSHDFRITLDTSFLEVIRRCATSQRKYFQDRDNNTWINSDVIQVYQDLHRLGVAHSVEVWRGKDLVGGLYGLSLGKMFFGESMFYLERDCSKLALYSLCGFLQSRGFLAIDCQVYSEHLESLGAVSLFKKDFLGLLCFSHQGETLIGNWEIGNWGNWGTQSE